jgi:hypothetical protein
MNRTTSHPLNMRLREGRFQRISVRPPAGSLAVARLGMLCGVARDPRRAGSSRVERRVCALCGLLYTAVTPAGLDPQTTTKLCGMCLLLPLPPTAPYERPKAGDRPHRAGDGPEEPTTA